MGVNGESFRKIKSLDVTSCPFSEVPKGNENAVWVKSELVCTVKYMMKTENGGMRQLVFKRLRDDKSPEECIDKLNCILRNKLFYLADSFLLAPYADIFFLL